MSLLSSKNACAKLPIRARNAVQCELGRRGMRLHSPTMLQAKNCEYSPIKDIDCGSGLTRVLPHSSVGPSFKGAMHASCSAPVWQTTDIFTRSQDKPPGLLLAACDRMRAPRQLRGYSTAQYSTVRVTEIYEVREDGTERFVVAGRPLHRGDVIFDRVFGRVLKEPVQHSIQVTNGVHVDTDGDLRFVNHSCAPNCRMEVSPAAGGEDPFLRITVVAPTIEPGEELTVDYNAFELEMVNPFDCVCGVPSCRKRITGFTRLPVALRRQYLDHGHNAEQPSLLTPFVKAWGEANLETAPRS